MQYQQYLSLDLIPLQANQLEQAVHQFELLYNPIKTDPSEQNILIFCALGYSRSSAILCAWLIKQEHVNSVQEAVLLIQQARPWIVLKQPQLKELNLFQLKLKGLAP